MKSNYKQKYDPKHSRSSVNGLVYEHILVAEQKLGRKLKPEEVVHHIDMDRQNNTADNLMVFATQSDHAAYHRGAESYEIDSVWYAKKKSETLKQCEYCGKSFIMDGKKLSQKYCSAKCWNLARMKTSLTLEEIQNYLYSNNGNMSAVAKMCGVSANAIIHRLKRGNLPYHSRDYKK